MNTEQKEAYLKNPYHCPYCLSDKIFAWEFEGETKNQKVECPDCGKQWTDVYTLTDVEQEAA